MADDVEVTPAPEEGVVEVTLEPGTEEAVTAKAPPEPKPEPKKPVTPKATTPPPPAEQDEATKAIHAAVEAERARRQAAEATAQAERNRANQADQQRRQREAELQRANEVLESNQLAGLNQGIEAAQREIASYQAEFKTALAAAKFEKVAELQTKIGKATATLDRLETNKQDLEAGRGRSQTHEGRVEETTQPVQASPFEQYVSGFDPVAQAWH